MTSFGVPAGANNPNHATDCTGSDVLINIMFGDTDTNATAVRSFAGSYESLL